MSVGFGFSVGDFLAALKLVGTVIDALRESGNSSSTFRNLINELYTLESALLRVKRLEIDDELQVQKLALRQAASQCQRTIDAFWLKAQKYQPHLQCNGSGSRLKDGWAKIRWATCKKDDLEKFRAEINGHTSSIEILLLTVQLEASNLEAKRQDARQRSWAGSLQAFSSQVMMKLGAMANSMAQTVEQGKILLDVSRKVVETNVRVFSMIYDIQLFILRIPGQIQRQQPVYFTDPFNKLCPFHLEFVVSAEALLAVMKVRFQNAGCDTALLDRGDFVIEESGTENVIDLSKPWDSCFFPGQKTAMNVVMKKRKTESTQCPTCQTEYTGAADEQITCTTCGTVFRRFEEIITENGVGLQSRSEDDASDASEELAQTTVARDIENRKHDDASGSKFRRIHLIVQETRIQRYCSIKSCPRSKTGFGFFGSVELQQHERSQHGVDQFHDTEATFDMNDTHVLDLYLQVAVFHQDRSRDSLVFPPTLSPLDRRMVHTFAHQMELLHVTKGIGDQRCVCISRFPDVNPTDEQTAKEPSSSESNKETIVITESSAGREEWTLAVDSSGHIIGLTRPRDRVKRSRHPGPSRISRRPSWLSPKIYFDVAQEVADPAQNPVQEVADAGRQTI